MRSIHPGIALGVLVISGTAVAGEGEEGGFVNALEKVADKSPTIHFGEQGYLTFGLREQFLFENDEVTGTNDFSIRRSRFKVKGSILSQTRFKVEYKFDDIGREGKESKGEAEDISFFYDLQDMNANVRIGLYDAPFSRGSLTSDSKLLFVDRSLLHDMYKDQGLADNTIGIQLSGLAADRLEYSIGLFDSEKYDAETNNLMPMARLVGHLLDPEKGEYEASRPGSEDNHLNVGISSGMLDSIDDGGGRFDLWGTEADVYLSMANGISCQAEYGTFDRDFEGGSSITSEGYYAQAGYRLPWNLGPGTPEVAYRFQRMDEDDSAPGDRTTGNTIGINWYRLGHNLKVQADYTFYEREDSAGDGGAFRIQLQVDF
jgi:phosphate-selective porin